MVAQRRTCWVMNFSRVSAICATRVQADYSCSSDHEVSLQDLDSDCGDFAGLVSLPSAYSSTQRDQHSSRSQHSVNASLSIGSVHS